MIIEGLKLTLLGMVVVFAFLVLLVLVVKLSTKILKPFTDREASALGALKSRKTWPSSARDDRKIMAVISAAVAAHRGRIRVGRNT